MDWSEAQRWAWKDALQGVLDIFKTKCNKKACVHVSVCRKLTLPEKNLQTEICKCDHKFKRKGLYFPSLVFLLYFSCIFLLFVCFCFPL